MADFPFSPDAASLAITRETPYDVFGTDPKLSASITVPSLTIQAGISSMTLPMLGISGQVVAGWIVEASLSIPAIELQGDSKSGKTYDADIVLPKLSVEAYFGASTEITMPSIGLSGQVINGATLSASVTMSSIGASGAIRHNGILVADIALPVFVVGASLTNDNLISAGISLPGLALAADGYTGHVVTATITLPMLSLDGEAYAQHTLLANIEIPMLLMTATTGDRATASVTTYVMNTSNVALTNYEPPTFNSAAKFNGAYLFAGDGGVYAISGDLDDTALIDAYARLGVTDFGSDQQKRVTDAFIGYRADGEVRLVLITDEHHEYEYRVYPRNQDTVHANKIKTGKGVRGRYWQAEIGNVNGANFELDSLQLSAELLKRKT